MTNPIIRIHDVETDSIIDREMTKKEYDDYLARRQIDDALFNERVTKEQAKQSAIAKLAALGLTEDEANAIVSA